LFIAGDGDSGDVVVGMIFVDAEIGLMVLEVLEDLSHEKMEVPSYTRSMPRLSHLCGSVFAY
jgi:hypothetical protein